MTKVLRQQIQLKPAFKVSQIRILTQSSFGAFLLINMNMYMTISVWLGVLFYSKLVITSLFEMVFEILILSISMGSRGGSKWMRKVYCWHGHSHGKDTDAWNSWEWQSLPLVWVGMLTVCAKIPKPSFLAWGICLGLLSCGDCLLRPAKLFLTSDSRKCSFRLRLQLVHSI